MLTPKQHRLLMYLHDQIRKNGYAPSYDEMRDALDLRSKSGIHRLVTALEERKFIRRLPHKARTIEILRIPSANADPSDTGRMQGTGLVQRVDSTRAAPERGSSTLAASLSGLSNAVGELISLPLSGRIAAGTPIEALRHTDQFVEVPSTMLGRGVHYALTVEGDSMEDAGILDGDTVIIEECADPKNGEIVVALVDREEVTLKRLRRRARSIALEPANRRYETRVLPPDRVEFQGRLVGLIRRYNS